MKKTFKFLKIGALVAFLPLIASAQATGFTILNDIYKIVNIIIPILITVAVIYLIIAIIQYVIAGDEEKKAEGRSHMIYGIIGLFVIVGVWGLVAILFNTFNVSSTTKYAPPSTLCPVGFTPDPNNPGGCI